ncbi:BTAD domain-containing putative transcriptional regulator [Labrys monachus]|uniref:DNA-binding SARP family transcriptional activator n=1 Tax=Labrys monachus TaxID=217067 RepID=A0ABU0FDS5_9HYPH|nr:BTAD domain-containing putative transcriptional regulator [Labrys monachus]MDQ0392309.1 DNA-binding SARP family transcriptional activator [Labrys monachus]
MLILRVLGDFSASFNGRRLDLPKRKTRALIAYLALSDNAHDTRERLVGLLWSESDEERARASLRQAVHDIKSACDAVGFDGFRPGKLTLSLERGRYQCDVDEIIAAIVRQDVPERLLSTQRLPDALLEGLDDLDPAFQIWVQTRRQLLHDRLTLGLEALLPPEGSGIDSSAVATALLNLDPTHEPACRHLIRARAARGDIGAAMKAYKTLWDVLEADFDIEPSKETQDLIVEIKQQADWSATRPSRPAALQSQPVWAKGVLISVCPFDAGGVPTDKRYVVDGFQHELIACLMRFREWSVRPLAPDQKPVPASWFAPPEYVVEGTTYESGGEIRLIITFRDAATSICVWSERFKLSLATWLEMQQQIVRKIATALNVHLSAERLRRIGVEGSIASDIHDRWLRGQAMVHRLASEDWRAALAVFEELVRDAPDYGPALTSLVQMNNTEHIARPGVFLDRARLADVLVLARRAAHLDPLDSRAQLNLAWTHQLARRADESTLHASLAIDLNGSDPWTLMSAGLIFAYCGKYAEARDFAAASVDITPLATPQQMTYLSVIKFLVGDYEACIELAANGLDASPGFRMWVTAALARLGRSREAAAELDKTYVRIRSDWHGKHNPTPENMARWMLHLYPIAVAEDWEHLRAGLGGAGAPVEKAAFGVW